MELLFMIFQVGAMCVISVSIVQLFVYVADLIGSFLRKRDDSKE
mgnify:CR=1